MAVRIEPDSEPIPGYRLIERLGGGGFGEVWKCVAPGGLHKAIKFVFGNLDIAGDSGHRAEQELKALSRVKTVRHPYILSLERFDIIDGQLLIIMELADRNLWDRYKECRSQGLPGIPRPELLGYMQEASEALDLMNSLYQLQHLDIKPQNLFLVHQHVKVADFGLVKDMEGSHASVTGGITPVYAAPETFDGRVTRFSDQYSLGIVFQELLTGQRPFSGANVRQLILQHLQAEPNLSWLEEHDRPIIGRALCKTPEQRYPTCSELARALVEATTQETAGNSTAQPVRGRSPYGRVDDSAPQDGHTWGPQGSKTGDGRAGQGESEQQLLAPRTPAPPRARESNQSPTHFIGIPGAASPRAEAPPAPQTPPGPRITPRVARPPDTPAPAREMDRGGALCPALIVGIGGLGAQVLQSFRSLLGEQFGSPEALPNVRTVLIDTDPEVLEFGGLPPDLAKKMRELLGPPAFPLTPAEMLAAPLNRPSHYLRNQQGRIPVETWLNQRMVYRIPREQVTTGIRALGRLALVDHVRPIQRRLQLELEACRDVAALDRAGKSTGRGVRAYRPRIFLVAGLMGGTGSGMFLDLAYLLRNLARQMGTPNPHITGLLFIPQMEKRGSQHSRSSAAGVAAASSHQGLRPSAQGIDTATRVMPLGNACAALTELLHYSQPGTEFQARYFEREVGLADGESPFNPTYLLPLPETPQKKESQELIGMTAHFLFGECASAFGRWRGAGAEADVPGDPVYRTLGLYRVAFPRRQVVQQVALRSLRKIVERWLSKDARPLVNEVREWVTEQWRGHELGAEHFITRIQDACEKRLGKDPELAFNAALEPLLNKLGVDSQKGFLGRVRGGAAAVLPDTDEVLETLVRFEQLLGRPQVVQEGDVYTSTDWNVSSSTAAEVTGAAPGMPEMTVRLPGHRDSPTGALVLALREAALAIGTDWSQKLAELPVKLIEKPAFRLAGAEESVRQVVASIEQVLERHEPFGRELADKAAEAYGLVLTFLNSLGETRSWPRRGLTPEQVVELLRTYSKARYQSLVLQQVLSVYVSLRGCLTDELREINFCRVRLQELLVQLDGEKSEGKPERSPNLAAMTEGRVRHLFPKGWSNLKEAIDSVAEGLTGEDLLQMDVQLQQMIRSNPPFGSLVNFCLASRNLTKELAQALRGVAMAFVEEKLGATDAAQLFLAQSDDKEAVGEELLTCYEEAVPESAATAPGASRASWERVVIGVPDGEAGEALRTLAQKKFEESDLVLTNSEENLTLYREWSGLRLAEIDPLGPAGQEAYQCLLLTENFTPHSRADVAFEPPH